MVKLVEDGLGLPPSVIGGLVAADGVVGVAEVGEDAGFGVVVVEVAAQGEGVGVVAEVVVGVAEAVPRGGLPVAVAEFLLQGEGLPGMVQGLRVVPPPLPQEAQIGVDVPSVASSSARPAKCAHAAGSCRGTTRCAANPGEDRTLSLPASSAYRRTRCWQSTSPCNARAIAAAISPLGTRLPRNTSLIYPADVRSPKPDGIRRAISRYDGLPARARSSISRSTKERA
jgi:hypothetical protein